MAGPESDRALDRGLTECPNQTEYSKFADKPSNSTQLKQMHLDSLSLGHYIDPRHEARSHLGPTDCQHEYLELVQQVVEGERLFLEIALQREILCKIWLVFSLSVLKLFFIRQ